MRKLMTALCCCFMAFMGYSIINNSATSDDLYSQNSLHAATIPSWNYDGPLPLDLALSKAKELTKDTIVIHDTVEVKNTKYIRVPAPKSTTDTIYVPLDMLREIEVVPVKNKSPGEGEDSLDETHGVVLIIDGHKVYSSKPESTPLVSDEP